MGEFLGQRGGLLAFYKGLPNGVLVGYFESCFVFEIHLLSFMTWTMEATMSRAKKGHCLPLAHFIICVAESGLFCMITLRRLHLTKLVLVYCVVLP